ncbi:MAG: histidine kinase [Nitrospirae bacterium]|nr:MAG: histidine kinase [Nitrospirota bacterium]
MDQRTIFVAVSDIFFYTKIRDALLPHGYRLERIRTQDEVKTKAGAGHPAAMILDMNDLTLDAFQALEQLKADADLQTIPTLAFANHEEVETWKRARELGVAKIVSRNEFSARTRELVEEVIGHQPTARR